MSDTFTDDERPVAMRVEQFRRALRAGGVTDWSPFLAGVTGGIFQPPAAGSLGQPTKNAMQGCGPTWPSIC